MVGSASIQTAGALGAVRLIAVSNPIKNQDRAVGHVPTPHGKTFFTCVGSPQIPAKYLQANKVDKSATGPAIRSRHMIDYTAMEVHGWPDRCAAVLVRCDPLEREPRHSLV